MNKSLKIVIIDVFFLFKYLQPLNVLNINLIIIAVLNNKFMV